MIRLRTREGLLLEPLSESDATALHALWTAPGVRRFIWDDEVIPFERTSELVETNRRLFAERQLGLWGARRDGDPGLVGFGGFWHFREPPELELLYSVADPEWGKGYATDIGRAVVDYGFTTLRMPVIRASTDADNTRSVRVLEKLGFRLTNRATVKGLDTLFFELTR